MVTTMTAEANLCYAEQSAPLWHTFLTYWTLSAASFRDVNPLSSTESGESLCGRPRSR